MKYLGKWIQWSNGDATKLTAATYSNHNPQYHYAGGSIDNNSIIKLKKEGKVKVYDSLEELAEDDVETWEVNNGKVSNS